MTPDQLLALAALVVPAIFAITLHEVAHGWVARECGDPTAAEARRLSLNPLRHVDPIGTLLVPAATFLVSGFVFGWAKPVPVDWRRLRRPRRDIALVALAGPGANLAMIVGWVLLHRLLLAMGVDGLVAEFVAAMCRIGILANAILMLLNLLPVPPLDGSRVVTVLLPPRAAATFNAIAPFGLLIMVALMMTGILSRILGPPLAFVLGQAGRASGLY